MKNAVRTKKTISGKILFFLEEPPLENLYKFELNRLETHYEEDFKKSVEIINNNGGKIYAIEYAAEITHINFVGNRNILGNIKEEIPNTFWLGKVLQDPELDYWDKNHFKEIMNWRTKDGW